MKQKIITAKECSINGPVISLIVAITSASGRQYKKIRMTDDLAKQFRQFAATHLLGLAASLTENSSTLVEYDAGYRTESHEIDYIDANQSQYAGLKTLLDDIPCAQDISVFEISGNETDQLSFYIIQIQDLGGQTVRLFRKYSQKKELSRGKMIAALYNNGTFDKIEDKLFLFDEQIDFVEIDRIVFINNMYGFQLAFKYFEQIREFAAQTLAEINTHIPISNFDEFQECCNGQMQMLAKLQSISRKAYLRDVTIDDLKRTISSFGLDVQTIDDNGQEKLVFDKRNRWNILKLLDDDFLGSIMTSTNYMVNSKRAL